MLVILNFWIAKLNWPQANLSRQLSTRDIRCHVMTNSLHDTLHHISDWWRAMTMTRLTGHFQETHLPERSFSERRNWETHPLKAPASLHDRGSGGDPENGAFLEHRAIE